MRLDVVFVGGSIFVHRTKVQRRQGIAEAEAGGWRGCVRCDFQWGRDVIFRASSHAREFGDSSLMSKDIADPSCLCKKIQRQVLFVFIDLCQSEIRVVQTTGVSLDPMLDLKQPPDR